MVKTVIFVMYVYTAIPHLLKVYFMPFAFMKDLHYYLLLLTKRNPKRVFTFMKNQKYHSAFILQVTITEAAHTKSSNYMQHLSIQPP